MAFAVAPRHSILRDLGLLLARVTTGVIFVAHGYQKVFDTGTQAVTDMVGGLGVPFPEIAGPAVAWIELIGGALLVLGALTPVVGVVLAIDMLVAALLVHAPSGIFVDAGGWELVGALGAAALAIAAAGAGRLSIDHAILGRRARRRPGRRRTSAGAAASDAPEPVGAGTR